MPSLNELFEFGQEVLVLVKNNNGEEWIEGKIMGVRSETLSFDILFDDGAGGESDVPAARIRQRPRPREEKEEGTGMGSDVQRRPRRGPKRVGSAESLGLTTENGGDEGFRAVTIVGGFSAGDAVECRFQGKEWRAATVMAVREEGSYDVEYGDGLKDMGMPPPMVRSPPLPPPSNPVTGGGVEDAAGRRERERAAHKKEKRRRRRAERAAAEESGGGGGGETGSGVLIDGMTHKAACDRVQELEGVVKRLLKKATKQERVIESLREKVVEWQEQSTLPSKAQRAEAAAAAAAAGTADGGAQK